MHTRTWYASMQTIFGLINYFDLHFCRFLLMPKYWNLKFSEHLLGSLNIMHIVNIDTSDRCQSATHEIWISAILPGGQCRRRESIEIRGKNRPWKRFDILVYANCNDNHHQILRHFYYIYRYYYAYYFYLVCRETEDGEDSDQGWPELVDNAAVSHTISHNNQSSHYSWSPEHNIKVLKTSIQCKRSSLIICNKMATQSWWRIGPKMF